jgi:hypothetical protein
MKITLHFCFILCSLLSSCSRISIEEKHVHNIINRFNSTQERQRNLYAVGIGSSIPENVEKFIIRFKSQEYLTQDQARNLMVHCANDLLISINSDREVRPYLHHYPFTSEDIDIMICFVDDHDQLLQYPFIGLVSIADGKIHTCYYNPEQQRYYKQIFTP